MGYLVIKGIRICMTLLHLKGIWCLLIPWKAFSLHVVSPLIKLCWLTREFLSMDLSSSKKKHKFSNIVILTLLLFDNIILIWKDNMYVWFSWKKMYLKVQISECSTLCFHLKDRFNLTWSFIMKNLLCVVTLVIENLKWSERGRKHQCVWEFSFSKWHKELNISNHLCYIHWGPNYSDTSWGSFLIACNPIIKPCVTYISR